MKARSTAKKETERENVDGKSGIEKVDDPVTECLPVSKSIPLLNRWSTD
jgi:hypothetical protein